MIVAMPDMSAALNKESTATRKQYSSGLRLTRKGQQRNFLSCIETFVVFSVGSGHSNTTGSVLVSALIYTIKLHRQVILK